MNKLRKVTLSFILSLLLITGVMPAGTTYSPVVSVEAAVSKKQTAKFVKAVDGDTAKLSVKGRTYTFRFLAIDTPETVKPNTPVAFMGKRASDYTKSELKKAKKIQIQYDGNKTDKYGRKLAWIWVDGKLLQDKLVRKGYARVYYIYGKYKYTNILQKSEKKAKKKKLGIWKNYSAAFPDSSSSKNTTTPTKESNNYVWVSRSGSKYHSYTGCIGMKNPSKIKKADAVSKGYTACKKCY